MNLSISIDTWVCLCSIFIVFIFCSIIVFRYRNSEKLVANRRMVEFFPLWFPPLVYWVHFGE